MNTHKRDRKNRAFNHGYRVGLAGKSVEQCPYDSVIELRGFWLSGWREGREQYFGAVSIQNV
jgi:ribosome modulation factor